jgi:WD40 repeat protein
MINHSRYGLLIIAIIAFITLACSFPVLTGDTAAATEPAQSAPDAGSGSTSSDAGHPVISAANAASLAQNGEVSAPDGYSLNWATDGVTVQVLTPTGVITFDAATLTNIYNVTLASAYSLMDLSPSGRYILVTTDRTNIEIRSALDGSLINTLTPGYFIQAAGFTTDSEQILVASGEAWQVQLFDRTTLALVNTLTGFETAAPVYTAFMDANPDTMIYVARATAQTQNIHTGALGPSVSHEDFITATAISPDGLTLVTSAGGTIDGSYTSALYVWDTTTGAQVLAMPTVSMPHTPVYSPDGTLLAVAVDGNIILWNTLDWTQAAVIASPGGNVTGLAFSPDGTALDSIAEDGILRRWMVAP